MQVCGRTHTHTCTHVHTYTLTDTRAHSHTRAHTHMALPRWLATTCLFFNSGSSSHSSWRVTFPWLRNLFGFVVWAYFSPFPDRGLLYLTQGRLWVMMKQPFFFFFRKLPNKQSNKQTQSPISLKPHFWLFYV